MNRPTSYSETFPNGVLHIADSFRFPDICILGVMCKLWGSGGWLELSERMDNGSEIWNYFIGEELEKQSI